MNEPQDSHVRSLDARSLRGLAHPLRMQLLDALRFGGPATASQLAGKLGESSGATSYHLRQLAVRRALCTEDRPASEVRNEPKKRYESRIVVLKTRDVTPQSILPAIDASGQPIPPCHICGQPASLRNAEAKPEHYSCRQRQGAPS